MCRLFAYAAPVETTVAEVIGAVNAEAFQRMTTIHNDGWGSAWLAAGPGETVPEVESVRVSTPGQHDPMLASAIHEVPSYARLVHLRLATDTHKRTKTNTHPFVVDGMAFAHNGSIIPVDRFDELITPEYLEPVEGSTDSERYFAYVRQTIDEQGGTTGDGIATAVRTLRSVFPEASLNAVVLTEEELFVVHANSTAKVTEDSFRACGIDPEQLPDDHRDDYYKLGMLQLGDGSTVFASTGIDLAGWTRVPDDTLTRIDLETLELSQLPIFAGREGTARRERAALNDQSIATLAR